MEEPNDLAGVEINSIKPINTDTVHRICSGQVVLSLAVAVKELVENSLDAGATNIDVRLKNYGIDLIEVSDNGSGVTEDNFSALTLKYHTSKLNDYSDLLGVASYGFRGEALSSLCSLAELTITTRHRSCQFATKLQYDSKGNITSKTPCSRQIGTTVSLSNLFCSLPVRKKEFHKNAKREFNKMTNLLYAYCLISAGVKITCTNQVSANNKSIVVATQGSFSFKDNIACVFGVKQLQNIFEIKTEFVPNIKENILRGLSGEVAQNADNVTIEDVEIDLSEDSNDAQNDESKIVTSTQKSQGYKNLPAPVELTGFISSCAHGCGRSSSDRQFYFVNSRPCEPSKVMKLVNEVYRQYNPNQYPFIFLNINVDRLTVDVNVTPDKRKLFLTKEKAILDVIKASLIKLYEDIPRTLKIDYSVLTSQKLEPELSQPRIFNSFLKQFSNETKSCENISRSSPVKSELKRKSTTSLDSFISVKKNYVPKEEIKSKDEIIKDTKLKTICFEAEMQNISEENNQKNNNDDSDRSPNSTLDSNSDIVEESHTIYCKTTIIEANTPKAKVSNVVTDKKDLGKFAKTSANCKLDSNSDIVEESHTIYCNTTSIEANTPKAKVSIVVTDKEDSGSLKYQTNSKLDSTSDIVEESDIINCNTTSIEAKTPKTKGSKIVTDKEDLGKYARKSVNLKISMEDITKLVEISNKNFSKTKPDRIKFKSGINPVFNKKCEEELNKEISKDSFKSMAIIGQFNLGFIITKLEDDLFIIDQHATDEIYNFETLQRTTELTSQKLVIPQQLELTGVNEQILMDNLEIFKKNGFTFNIDENALPTKRVKLLTIPMSKNWIFGKDDIEELLFMLKENQSEYCRPSRVRAMFASRACRKSVMIGTALSKADMRQLVDHMAEIDKPWNCPHGRPTIRHLVNLAMVQTNDERNQSN